MKISKTLSALAALAIVGLMTTSAHALPFNYTVQISANGGAFTAPGATNTVTLANGGILVLDADDRENLGVPTDVALAAFNISSGSAPINQTVNLVLRLIITDLPSAQTGIFDINTSLMLSGLTANSGIQDVVNTTIVPVTQTIGGFPYFLSTFRFSADTVNDIDSEGNFSIRINADAMIPEPSTVAMAGIGLLGLAGYGLRRRRRMA